MKTIHLLKSQLLYGALFFAITSFGMAEAGVASTSEEAFRAVTIDPKKLKDVTIAATVFEGKVYPIDTGKSMEAKVSEKTVKALLAYHANTHNHGDACMANQILQEGFKEMKSIP